MYVFLETLRTYGFYLSLQFRYSESGTPDIQRAQTEFVQKEMRTPLLGPSADDSIEVRPRQELVETKPGMAKGVFKDKPRNTWPTSTSPPGNPPLCKYCCFVIPELLLAQLHLRRHVSRINICSPMFSFHREEAWRKSQEDGIAYTMQEGQKVFYNTDMDIQGLPAPGLSNAPNPKEQKRPSSAGITRPSFYFGLAFTFFALHIEDKSFIGANRSIIGAPKVW